MIRRSIASLAVLASLVLPTSALAAEELAFDPVEEFIVKPWFSLKLGPIDMGVSKAVLYLWLAAAIAIIGTLLVTRGGLKQRPGRFQTVVETLYAFTETNIGRATLPRGAYTRWFPYVATLFVFIWVLNMISFIPLPLDTHNKLGPIPGLTIYAATSNLSVTLALTVVTLSIAHFEGIRANGARKYFASWVPETGMGGVGGAVLKGFLIPLEVLSQILRFVSLSVRLFANMLAGHLLIIMCLGFAVLLGNVFVAVAGVPVAVAFYIFEWGLVASLQAYIFAMLAGIYIGSAIEANH